MFNLIKFTAKVQNNLGLRLLSTTKTRFELDQIIHLPDDPSIKIPTYAGPPNESVEKKRARLLFQSRKRGMLENDLLLSTFAAKYLKSFNKQELEDYDKLINTADSDWDIYYWITGKKEVPTEFKSNIMNMLKDHVKNNDGIRNRQPDL